MKGEVKELTYKSRDEKENSTSAVSMTFLMTNKVVVRAAVPEDIPTIHDFVTQLAVFEKCPERVLATHETLAKTLGLESPPSSSDTDISATQLRPGQFAKCVIAQIDCKNSGFAIYFYNYSTVPPVLYM